MLFDLLPGLADHKEAVAGRLSPRPHHRRLTDGSRRILLQVVARRCVSREVLVVAACEGLALMTELLSEILAFGWLEAWCVTGSGCVYTAG